MTSSSNPPVTAVACIAVLIWGAVFGPAWGQSASAPQDTPQGTPQNTQQDTVQNVAQDTSVEAASASDRDDEVPAMLSLDEAVQIALVNNYTLRSTRLDAEEADLQVREAWGEVFPSVTLNSNYTRNVRSPNPFAGSEAGGLFQSLGFLDWLSFNERARTDGDPTTEPLSFPEFEELQRQGQREAGIAPDESGNPFAVPNQIEAGVTISQVLFSSSAFSAIRGASRLREINERGTDRQEQLLIDEVREAYYQAVLATESARVTRQSVERAEQTLRDAERSVEQGTAPKFDRLSAEVQVSNLRAELTDAENQAELAVNALKNTMGIPIDTRIVLTDDLDAPPEPEIIGALTIEQAAEEATRHRPDLEQARIAVELREIDRNITRGGLLPTVSAFASANYVGAVPDNRTTTISDPTDPFAFEQETRGFFDDAYWDPAVNVGIRLSWNIFDGNQTRRQVQQRSIAVEQARIEREQAREGVKLEVEQALRTLRAAQDRLQSQTENVDRAELNYEFAQQRLREGVARPIEEREASQQLDQARLNRLQAAFDYVRALSALETAIGRPIRATPDATFQF